MLYSVEDLLSNDISVSAMVLNVVQMDMTKIHSRTNQNIVDRMLYFLEELYWRLYTFS